MTDFNSSTILLQFLPVEISSICAEQGFTKNQNIRRQKKAMLHLLVRKEEEDAGYERNSQPRIFQKN